MLVLGIETSCDETGIALYDSATGFLTHTLYTQAAMHAAYGGVVPELASRDHIQRILPLLSQTLAQAHKTKADINAIAYTSGPGLAGALLAGASVAEALGLALNVPVLPVHHLEGHLLSPLLAQPAPPFPFIALLVSGGHTQLLRVGGIGDYCLLGDTLDDAAGEAFDKTAKLLGLPYPGGPALAQLATEGRPGRYKLPRPMLNSQDLNFSFSGLKTAVLTTMLNLSQPAQQDFADIAYEFQEAATEVLTAKALAAMAISNTPNLVVAGGVGANVRLRQRLQLATHQQKWQVFYPPFDLCTDNGAMIAFCGAKRLLAKVSTAKQAGAFAVKPRWPLPMLSMS